MVSTNSDINEIRIAFSRLKDESYIEVNLEIGGISWMSELALSTIGYDEKQLKVMSVYDMIPDEFHENLSNVIVDGMNGKGHKYVLWPFKGIDGSVLWFYSVKEDVTELKNARNIFWYKINLVDKTIKDSQGHASMTMNMNLISVQNEIKRKVEENENRTDIELRFLKDKNVGLETSMSEIKQKFSFATSAMEKAATAAIRSSSDVSTLRNEFREGMARQTTEIIRLINMDSQHDELIKNFNDKVSQAAEKAVEKAVEEISQKSKDVSTEIIIRAGNAGKNIAKKVTVPVSVIAVVMTVVQFILSNWTKIFH